MTTKECSCLLSAGELTAELLHNLCRQAEFARHESETTEGARGLRHYLPFRHMLFVFDDRSERTSTVCQVAAGHLDMGYVARQVPTGPEFSEHRVLFSHRLKMLCHTRPHIIGLRLGHNDSFLEGARQAMGMGIPVFNAGTHDDHPTRVGQEMYTVWRQFRDTPELTFAVLGDFRARSARQFADCAVAMWKSRLIFSQSPPMEFERDEMQRVYKKAGALTVTFEDNLGAALEKADVVYCARRFDREEGNGKPPVPQITPREMEAMKKNAILMHSAPHMMYGGRAACDISRECEEDPRAVYWSQINNGIWFTVALIAHLLGRPFTIR